MTQQVMFRNIHVYKYVYACSNNEEEAMNLKDVREAYVGGLGERKEKGEV